MRGLPGGPDILTAEKKYGRAQGTLIFRKMSFFVAP